MVVVCGHVVYDMVLCGVGWCVVFHNFPRFIWMGCGVLPITTNRDRSHGPRRPSSNGSWPTCLVRRARNPDRGCGRAALVPSSAALRGSRGCGVYLESKLRDLDPLAAAGG